MHYPTYPGETDTYGRTYESSWHDDDWPQRPETIVGCPKCGSRVRADRGRCPGCGTPRHPTERAT